jgi:hypothetical protein
MSIIIIRVLPAKEAIRASIQDHFPINEQSKCDSCGQYLIDHNNATGSIATISTEHSSDIYHICHRHSDLIQATETILKKKYSAAATVTILNRSGETLWNGKKIPSVITGR